MRLRIVTATAALVLLSAGTAGAASTSYFGPVTPQGSVVFKLVTKADGKRTVKVFEGTSIPCTRADGTQIRVSTRPAVPVKVGRRGGFSGTYSVTDFDGATTRIVYSGRIAKSGAAKGTVSVSIEGSTNACTSGDLPWTASQ